MLVVIIYPSIQLHLFICNCIDGYIYTSMRPCKYNIILIIEIILYTSSL